MRMRMYYKDSFKRKLDKERRNANRLFMEMVKIMNAKDSKENK